MQKEAAAGYDALFRRRLGMALQMGQDAAMIAANDVLHLGPKRAADFAAAYRKAVNTIAALMVEDQKSDKEYAYARGQVDTRLRRIVGEDNFDAWEERYST